MITNQVRVIRVGLVGSVGLGLGLQAGFSSTVVDCGAFGQKCAPNIDGYISIGQLNLSSFRCRQIEYQG